MIQQPSAVPTTEDVQKALEAARNNVTVLEAEAVRLDRLIGSQKRDLIAQEGAKRDLEDLITVAEGKLAILETQIDSSEQSLIEVNKQVDVASQLYTDTTERTQALSHDLDGREAAVAGREMRLAEAEADLKQRTEAFESVRDHYFAQIDRIKAAITAL